MPIDDVDSQTPYFDVFVWRSWFIPYEVRNTTTQHILSSEGEPYGILIGKFPFFLLWLEFIKIYLVILESVLFGLSFFQLSADAYTPVVWNMLFIIWHLSINSEIITSYPSLSTWMNAIFIYWFINVVTKQLSISRGGLLLLGGNPKGCEVAKHIATKFEVNTWMLSTPKNVKSVLSMNPGGDLRHQ